MLYFLFISCNEERKKLGEELKTGPKIAKVVPDNYKNANDPAFSHHQDTVYYGDHFFTGYRFSLYKNGDTAMLQSYFNGEEEGTQKKWYPGKLLAEERFFINGKKEGNHRTWWPDGKPQMDYTALDNEYEGLFRAWNNTGLLVKQFHYVKGYEDGSQRLWWDNGTVRANYVVKKGKKYGLIGLKLCANPYDSVDKK